MKAPQTEQARIAAALDELATVQAVLRVWVMALPEDDPIDVHTAGPLQVAMQAIAARLETAKFAQQGPGMELLKAAALVDVMKDALWLQCQGPEDEALSVDDLRRTAGLALHHLASGAAVVALNTGGSHHENP